MHQPMRINPQPLPPPVNVEVIFSSDVTNGNLYDLTSYSIIRIDDIAVSYHNSHGLYNELTLVM